METQASVLDGPSPSGLARSDSILSATSFISSMKPVKMALVQPAALQLLQKLAESTLGSGAAGEESEEEEGRGLRSAAVCGPGLWAGLR